MTKKEWLDIGLEKGIIDREDYEEVTFQEAFKRWFCMKMQTTKEATVDRIECTYNRHYRQSALNEKCISKIADSDIIIFLTEICTTQYISTREYGRIWQIIENVLSYMRDINIGGVPLHDWQKIKRNIPTEKLSKAKKKEKAINQSDIEYILKQVIDNKIYFRKQSACLCVCMNFYLGLRIGELSALRFEDFNFERGTIFVQRIESKYYKRDSEGNKISGMEYEVVDHTKTECSTRYVPITPEVKRIYELIYNHHKEQGYDSPYIAYDGNQTILSRSLDRTIRKLIELCETMYFSSHGIRKTFATTLHFNNVPTRVISDILGHSEMSTTERCYILNYEHHDDRYAQYISEAIHYTI